MKFLKKTLKTIFILAIILFIVGYFYMQKFKPTYHGSLQLENLEQEVKVSFDSYGIPHIFAQNQKDAMRALGYVHAQDRLWQMELMRRIAPGRLSEILGEDTIKTDLFFASLGIEEAAEKAIASMNKKGQPYLMSQAYLDGINQFIDKGALPVEFKLLNIQKEKYSIKDIYNIFGYMSFSFAIAHKTDPLLSKIQATLGNQYLKDLGLTTDPKSTIIPVSNKQDDYTAMASEMVGIFENNPTPAFIGSNSWVISPKKTATGKVLFANDPHIGFAQPAVWYEAHIKTPDYEMYGYHLAGTPFPLLGHNYNYAWGLTMFENDDLDFYKEENHPTDTSKYKTKDGYKSYQTRTETIKVKGQKDISLVVKETQHGPIMNNVIAGLENKQPLAMHWIYTQLPSRMLDGLYAISRATDIATFEKGVSMIHAPGLNVMYGDAQNNIAWWAAGKLYEMPKETNPKLLLDGTTGKDEPVRYLDFSENPHAINPPWNYVYSANNQPDSIAGMLYPGYYLPQDRAKRIVQLLEPKNDWSKKDIQNMLLDNTASMAPINVKALAKVIDTKSFSSNESKAWTILKNWKGENKLTSIGPVIYNKWIYLYLKNTLQDELGVADFNRFMNTILVKKTKNSLLQDTTAVWWDDVITKDIKETQSDVLNKSFKETVAALEKQLGRNIEKWTWNKVHIVEHAHAFSKKMPSAAPIFNVGPFPIEGSKSVINNTAFHYDDSGTYKVNHGPSTRRVIDFSDVEHSVSILPTGQSGNVFSKHYQDQAKMYVEGKFRPMLLNTKEIEADAKNVLILKPN